jgi:hypothetical protein
VDGGVVVRLQLRLELRASALVGCGHVPCSLLGRLADALVLRHPLVGLGQPQPRPLELGAQPGALLLQPPQHRLPLPVVRVHCSHAPVQIRSVFDFLDGIAYR